MARDALLCIDFPAGRIGSCDSCMLDTILHPHWGLHSRRIVGSGNDRPTPRIVLDILGADHNYDPEPLSFVSLGDGALQHNMGKVYSRLYECAGHVVPYLVVVKSASQRRGHVLGTEESETHRWSLCTS